MPHQTGPIDVPASDHPVPRDPVLPPGGDDLSKVVDQLSTAPGADDLPDDDAQPEDGAKESSG